MIMDSSLIKKIILRYLEEYEEVEIDELIDYIWRDQDLDIQEFPEQIVNGILKKLEKEEIVSVNHEIKKIVKLNKNHFFNIYQEFSENQWSNWGFTVKGTIILPCTTEIKLELLKDGFEQLNQSKDLDIFTSNKEISDSKFYIGWEREGIKASVIIDTLGFFYIDSLFKGEIFPELLKPSNLSEADVDSLNMAILGTGFFNIYSILKKIIQKIYEHGQLKILNIEFKRTRC